MTETEKAAGNERKEQNCHIINMYGCRKERLEEDEDAAGVKKKQWSVRKDGEKRGWGNSGSVRLFVFFHFSPFL